jgi:hypothetical protein
MMRPAAIVGIAPQALDSMNRYNWPGNVRELCRAAAREFLPRLRVFSPQGAGGLYPSDAVVFRAAGYRPQRVPDFCDARGALRWHGYSYGPRYGALSRRLIEEERSNGFSI